MKDFLNDIKLTSDGRVCRIGSRVYSNHDVYEGEFVDNQRHGKGITRYSNGDKYDGEFKNDIFHGYGIHVFHPYTDPSSGILISSKRYEGNYFQGKKHGRGAYFIGNGESYVGNFQKNLYSGYGVLRKINGDTYSGDFNNGKCAGEMLVRYFNDDKYEGNMVLNVFDGKGIFTWANNLGYYDGMWVRGKYHGEATRVYSNGDRYVGSFCEGEIKGKGTMHYSNGDQYIGDWENGQNTGHGIISYRNGDIYTGTFLKGVRYGEGKYLYKDGSYYDGEYRNIRTHPSSDTIYPVTDGRKHGLGQRLWSNGVQYQGQWERDLQHGPGILSSGNSTYTGGFYNGQKHGLCKESSGNVLGIKYVCSCNHSHLGHGVCDFYGLYNRGQICGMGKLKCYDGRSYDGEWLDGCRHGQGVQQYLKDGEEGDPDRMYIGGIDSMYRTRTYSGTWVENVREGHGVLTYVTGDSIEGVFRNGLAHGIMLYTFNLKVCQQEDKTEMKNSRNDKHWKEINNRNATNFTKNKINSKSHIENNDKQNNAMIIYQNKKDMPDRKSHDVEYDYANSALMIVNNEGIDYTYTEPKNKQRFAFYDNGTRVRWMDNDSDDIKQSLLLWIQVVLNSNH